MVKKAVKKKISKPKNILRDNEMQKVLLENFVSLQKVMTHLSQKFDGLTVQISELLKLFEDSAKVIVKNEMNKKNEDEGTHQLLQTMISVLDQNKIIAKSLVLMYETLLDAPETKSNSLKEKQLSTYPMPEKKILAKEEEMTQSNSPDLGSSFQYRR